MVSLNLSQRVLQEFLLVSQRQRTEMNLLEESTPPNFRMYLSWQTAREAPPDGQRQAEISTLCLDPKLNFSQCLICWLSQPDPDTTQMFPPRYTTDGSILPMIKLPTISRELVLKLSLWTCLQSLLDWETPPKRQTSPAWVMMDFESVGTSKEERARRFCLILLEGLRLSRDTRVRELEWGQNQWTILKSQLLLKQSGRVRVKCYCQLEASAWLTTWCSLSSMWFSRLRRNSCRQLGSKVTLKMELWEKRKSVSERRLRRKALVSMVNRVLMASFMQPSLLKSLIFSSISSLNFWYFLTVLFILSPLSSTPILFLTTSKNSSRIVMSSLFALSNTSMFVLWF